MRPASVFVAFCVVLAGCASSRVVEDGDLGAAPRGDDVLALATQLVTTPNGTPWLRVPGTEGNLEQARSLRDRLASEGLTARLQHFNDTLPLLGPTWCRNVIADRPGTELTSMITLAAHFDSRAHADKDPDPSRRSMPVIGANDGASGVAVVLELVTALGPMRHGLRVYLFDCEDQGDHSGGWAIGAQHAASQLTSAEREAMKAFILFDLVGDAELRIPREATSDQANPWLLDMAFGLAQREGLDRFDNVSGGAVFDDHVPFIEAGIPAIDLIHLDLSSDGDPFPSTHHTTFDDADHLSSDALGQVARLGYALVRHLDQKRI